MAKPKFISDGNEAVKINWVIKVIDEYSNIDKNKAYKIIALDENSSLAVIVSFKDVKDIFFTGPRHRSTVYKKNSTSIPLYAKVEVYGTHTDNLDKAIKAREDVNNKKLEKEERIRILGLGSELEDILIDTVKKYKEEMQGEIIPMFEKELAKLKVDGLHYKCEFRELTASEIAFTQLKNLGKDGWSFAFEVSGRYYFQRPRLKKS